MCVLMSIRRQQVVACEICLSFLLLWRYGQLNLPEWMA